MLAPRPAKAAMPFAIVTVQTSMLHDIWWQTGAGLDAVGTQLESESLQPACASGAPPHKGPGARVLPCCAPTHLLSISFCCFPKP